MPFIETRDESEYPWLATACWTDDGRPARPYEFHLERRAREACPSEFADAIRGAVAAAPARDSKRRVRSGSASLEARSPGGLGRLINGLAARLRGGQARPRTGQAAARALSADNDASLLGGRA